ncbi:MAG: exodeoxyribonuclease VII large subunit [Bacteroidota bacterium]
MNDLFGQSSTGQPLTLFQFNTLVKDVLGDSFPATYWIIAEISKITDRGHCYLELVEKDDSGTHAQARGTIWSSKYRKIAQQFAASTGQPLRQGLKILFNASLQYHALYGLSLDIHEVDPNYTIGELARQRQEILARLEKEGLLFLNSQLPLPVVPQRIAIVSSATAAGYQDFTHQLATNAHRYHFVCTLFPAVVQGNDAPASVVQALQQIQERVTEFDVAVIIRGGGSQSDLSCFDNYAIAATIARLPLPLLTGIGHERDETITDLVAHTQLKTPTAVATFLIDTCRYYEDSISNLFHELMTVAADQLNVANEHLEKQSLTLYHLVGNNLNQRKETLSRYENTLLRQAERQVDQQEKHFLQLTERLRFAAQSRLKHEKNRLEVYELKTHLLDPATLLKRGMSRTYLNGQLLTSIDQLKEGDVIETYLGNGRVQSLVVTFQQIASEEK